MIRFVPPDGCLDLAQTLDCGQAFRWQEIAAPGGSAWRGTAFGHTLTVQKRDGAFFFDCTQAEFDAVWFPYFDLGTDYAAIRRTLCDLHPVLRDAAAFAPGIRILRQEPWEALCSFIISQNNNIPRIRKNLRDLCAMQGGAFPRPLHWRRRSRKRCAPLAWATARNTCVPQARTLHRRTRWMHCAPCPIRKRTRRCAP